MNAVEYRYSLRGEAGRWLLLKQDERGEWVPVRLLTEDAAQRLVHALEG